MSKDSTFGEELSFVSLAYSSLIPDVWAHCQRSVWADNNVSSILGVQRSHLWIIKMISSSNLEVVMRKQTQIIKKKVFKSWFSFMTCCTFFCESIKEGFLNLCVYCSLFKTHASCFQNIFCDKLTLKFYSWKFNNKSRT